MMSRTLRISLAATGIWMLLMMLTISFANSAEPPSIILIVPDESEDMEIYIESGGKRFDSYVDNYVFEAQHRFYAFNLHKYSSTVVIEEKDAVLRIEMDALESTYNNIFTLDLEKGELIDGKTFIRDAYLVALRVMMTILIEGVIFWLFGYRARLSWQIFLVMNLVTQGGLNIYLNFFMPMQPYFIIGFVILEVFILIAEAIVMFVAIQEGRRIKRIAFAVAANLVSLFLGGWLLTFFPV